MIKIAIKNIRFLEIVSKIPIVRYFFILKVSENFQKISSEPVLNKFYTDIYVINKTSKKTEKERFRDLDKISLDFLKNQENCIIHDIAVSNGISSLDLFLLLNKENIKYNFTISDKFSEIIIKKGFITKVYNTDKQLLFAYFACFFAGDKNIFFPLTVLLYKILRKFKYTENYDYKLILLHPKVIEQIENNKIAFLNYDIFTSKISDEFTFVRAMNILNLGYFNESQIKIAIKNILLSMKENAVLLVGRTNAQNINNAGFYKKANDKLVHIKDVNAGSEIKNIIEKT